MVCATLEKQHHFNWIQPVDSIHYDCPKRPITNFSPGLLLTGGKLALQVQNFRRSYSALIMWNPVPFSVDTETKDVGVRITLRGVYIGSKFPGRGRSTNA